MNTRRPLSFWIKWLLLIALVLGVALGVTRALGKRKATNEAAMAAAESLQKTPTYTLSPTDVVTVQSIELTQTIALSGSVDALQTAAIKAKTAGEIQGLTKREGDSVKAGEVVARIDSTEAQARVRQAEQQAKSALAQVAIARRAQDNNQSLVQQGFISATALETSSANLAGEPPARRREELDPRLLRLLDGILDGETGGLAQPTPIRDALQHLQDKYVDHPFLLPKFRDCYFQHQEKGNPSRDEIYFHAAGKFPLQDRAVTSLQLLMNHYYMEQARIQ